MAKKNELGFEKSMSELEKIVEGLESGDLPLEEALKKFEEGVTLSRSLGDQLKVAENKIEVLTKDLKGDWQRKDLSESHED